MLTGPPPVPVCSMKRGLCQLQLAPCGVMSYQAWGSGRVYAYFILLHPSCSSKLIIVFTKLLPQVLNCLQVCLLFEQALLPLSLWVHRHPMKANMSHHVFCISVAPWLKCHKHCASRTQSSLGSILSKREFCDSPALEYYVLMCLQLFCSKWLQQLSRLAR